MPGFDPFLLFRVLRHCALISSLRFVSGSPASRSNSIPSFCFGFSGIAPGFDPFVLFQVFRHHDRIRPLHFVSGSLASRPIRSLRFVSSSQASRLDSIFFFSFSFSIIVPGFDPFMLFQVLRHHAGIRSLRFVSGSLHRARIRSLHFVSGSLASRSDSIFLFYFGFSSIVLGFDPFLLFRVLRRRAQILLSFLASYSNFPHLPQHCVRASLIIFGIVSEHLLSFPASCPTFIIFFSIAIGFSSSSSASCSSIAYLFRH